MRGRVDVGKEKQRKKPQMLENTKKRKKRMVKNVWDMIMSLHLLCPDSVGWCILSAETESLS